MQQICWSKILKFRTFRASSSAAVSRLDHTAMCGRAMCGPHCATRHVWPGSRRGKYPLAGIKPLYYHCTAGSRARPCGLWPSLPCSWPTLPCSWPSLSRYEQVNIKVFLAAVCCPLSIFYFQGRQPLLFAPTKNPCSQVFGLW